MSDVEMKNPKVTAIVTPTDREALEDIAKKQGRTVSNLVSRILHTWLVVNKYVPYDPENPPMGDNEID